jgi:hypothetical protein
MEFHVYAGSPALVGGSNQARQTFANPTARSMTQMAVRLEKLSGTGALTLSLYSGSTLIAQGSVPAASISGNGEGDNGGGAWAIVNTGSVSLPAGSGTLVLTAPSGTTYSIHGIRKGSSYGYTQFFTGGLAQRSTNGGSSWSNVASGQDDFQWYVR